MKLLKTILTVISVLMILFGTVFFLQGLDVLKGSQVMSGQPRWIYNGLIIALIGLAVLVGANWRRFARQKN